MWREIIEEFASAEPRDPAESGALDRTEEALGQSLPQDLRSFLLETDGLGGAYGTDVVWPVERILSDNLYFRNDAQFQQLYMPFDSLIFFGDNGGGDQFAFVRKPERDEVFVWDHETDSRSFVSAGLENYLHSALESEGEDWYR